MNILHQYFSDHKNVSSDDIEQIKRFSTNFKLVTSCFESSLNSHYTNVINLPTP